MQQRVAESFADDGTLRKKVTLSDPAKGGRVEGLRWQVVLDICSIDRTTRQPQ